MRGREQGGEGKGGHSFTHTTRTHIYTQYTTHQQEHIPNPIPYHLPAPHPVKSPVSLTTPPPPSPSPSPDYLAPPSNISNYRPLSFCLCCCLAYRFSADVMQCMLAPSLFIVSFHSSVSSESNTMPPPVRGRGLAIFAPKLHGGREKRRGGGGRETLTSLQIRDAVLDHHSA